jgi:hypothetical protein
MVRECFVKPLEFVANCWEVWVYIRFFLAHILVPAVFIVCSLRSVLVHTNNAVKEEFPLHVLPGYMTRCEAIVVRQLPCMLAQHSSYDMLCLMMS